jgi:hypothetical protein
VRSESRDELSTFVERANELGFPIVVVRHLDSTWARELGGDWMLQVYRTGPDGHSIGRGWDFLGASETLRGAVEQATLSLSELPDLPD